MKKIFFIITIGLSMTIMSCSNDSEQTLKTKTIVEDNNPPQTKIINEDVGVSLFSKLVNHKGGQILDVRTPEEWAEGTIKGAIKINYYDDDFQSQLSKLDKNKPVYVYCKSGGRSGKAAKQMEKMGFITIYNLDGGISAWKDAGKEIVK